MQHQNVTAKGRMFYSTEGPFHYGKKDEAVASAKSSWLAAFGQIEGKGIKPRHTIFINPYDPARSDLHFSDSDLILNLEDEGKEGLEKLMGHMEEKQTIPSNLFAWWKYSLGGVVHLESREKLEIRMIPLYFSNVVPAWSSFEGPAFLPVPKYAKTVVKHWTPPVADYQPNFDLDILAMGKPIKPYVP